MRGSVRWQPARHPGVVRVPVVAEGRAAIHRDGFPAEIVEMFRTKYDGWDVTALVAAEGARVPIEIPVARWLLAGRAQ